MRRVEVLICGSNYGRFYFEALRLSPSRFKIAGLLARGSAGSISLAREHHVPLFRNVEEIPPGVELACASLGMDAAAVVLALLRRGIHVLCEHPQGSSFIKKALRAASRAGVCFHLNAHFSDLPPAREFVRQARLRGAKEAPRFVHAMATDRSLYSLGDVLRRALGDLEPFSAESVSRGPLLGALCGRIGQVELLLQLQDGRHTAGAPLPDGSPFYLVDHRIELGFASGTLTLCSVAGPVIWNSNLHRRAAVHGAVWKQAGARIGPAYGELYDLRLRANLAAVSALARHAAGGALPPEQSPSHILAVSRFWERVSQRISHRR
jgi:thiazolinyl imide reductase